MNNQPFELVPHTADIAAAVQGRNLEELFFNAARALYFILLGPHIVVVQTERVVVVDSIDTDALLVDWLNELIYLVDAEQLTFSQFEMLCLSETHVRVRCHGGHIDPMQSGLVRDVKAATYHMAHIESTAEGLSVRVVFDV